MQVKMTRNARVIFALMVPLTCVAFSLAALAEPEIALNTMDVYDGFALAIVTVGVFIYNWFEEIPQEFSVENL